MKISGGQRQRIVLARSLLRKAKILILDEATSSLDTRAEADIIEGLMRLDRNTTVISITHRLGTLHKFDRVFKLSRGKLELFSQ